MSVRFSVIVPIYDVEPYLEECVESILHQSYDNWELILVDDGSPDECPSICDRYAGTDARVMVIHKKNGGSTSARKDGAKIASGDYICCVDGDDWIAPDYLEKMDMAVSKYHPDMVCCSSFSVRGGDRREEPGFCAPGLYSRGRIETVFFPLLLEKGNATYFPSSIWAKAIRRKLYCDEQIKVDSTIVMGEDRAVVIPCVYRSESVVMLEDSLYYYRFNPLSMTKKMTGFSWVSLVAFARHLPQRIDLQQYDFQAQYDRLIAHQFFLTAKSQFNRNEPYRMIRREILEKMDDPIFSEPIRRCHFGMSFRAKLMAYCLKLHLVWPMWLFQKTIGR